MEDQLMMDPLTGMPLQKNAIVPPVPSNELGYTKPLFNTAAQTNGQALFGDVQSRQNSVSPMFKKSCGY